MATSLMFWEALEELKRYQKLRYDHVFSRAKLINEQDLNENTREKCITAIEGVVEGVVHNLVEGVAPVLRVPKKVIGKDATGTGEDFVSVAHPRTSRRFVSLMNLLARSFTLLQEDTYATCRDLYYENVPLYEKQQNLDRALEDGARLLGVPRRALHVTATGKGLVAGDLTYVTHDGITVRVAEAHQGIIIPGCVSGLTSISSEARFVLVVEKDATFQKLLEAQILRTLGPCILITGKGYPDLGTRQLVHRLWAGLHIPTLGLMDADPFGLHIAAVYKFGALARNEPNLHVDGLVLLGVLPSELQTLNLPPKALLPLVPADHGKLASLEAHPALKGETQWHHQIKCLREGGMKAEIQSLTHIQPNFLSTVYLPTKISSGSWID